MLSPTTYMHNIKLESDTFRQFRFGIAVEVGSWSSGITWSSCTYNRNSGMCVYARACVFGCVCTCILSDHCLFVLSLLSVLSVTLVYCGQTVGRIQMKLRMQVGLSPGHIVLDGDPDPPPLKEHSPQFSAHIYCGQMARWIKIPLGRMAGLNPSNIVVDGDPAPPSQKKGQSTSNFQPMSIVPKRLNGSRCHLVWR